MATGNNSLKEYLIGQNPVVTSLFTNSLNVPTNPTTVTFQITDPTGSQTNYATGNAAVTNPSTGTWVFTFPGTVGLTIAGTWIWRCKGVGALIDADEGTWQVLTTMTATP